MRKKIMRCVLSLASAALMLFLFVAATPVQTSTAAPIDYRDIESDISISFSPPKGWHTKTARVGIKVKSESRDDIQLVEAKSIPDGDWSDITDDNYLDITDNCTVYARVTDSEGNVIAKSVYVECFDREKPTIKASQNGRLLRVEAHDDGSGIMAIFVDGKEYTDLTNDTLDIPLDTKNTKEEKITLQAKDNAGNLSELYTMKNPYYGDSDKEKAESSPPVQGAANTSQSTVTTPPTGNGAGQAAAPSSAPDTGTAPAPTVPAATTSTSSAGTGSASATSSQDTEMETGGSASGGIIAIGKKQFITIETRDEKVFYLIIDGERTSDNVYLVTEVTTQDLLSFTDDNGGAASSDIGNASPPANADTDTLIDGGILPDKPDNDPVKDDEVDQSSSQPDVPEIEEDSGKKGNPFLGWLVIAVLGLIAAFAGYLFLVVLPRKKAKEAFVDDDDDFEEEDYYREELEIQPEDTQPEEDAADEDTTASPGQPVAEEAFILDDDED